MNDGAGGFPSDFLLNWGWFLIAAGLFVAVLVLLTRYSNKIAKQRAAEHTSDVHREVRALLDRERRGQGAARYFGTVVIVLGVIAAVATWGDPISLFAWTGVAAGVLIVAVTWSAAAPIRNDHPVLKALLEPDSIVSIHREVTSQRMNGLELNHEHRVCITIGGGSRYSILVERVGRLQSEEARQAAESRSQRLISALHEIAPQARVGYSK